MARATREEIGVWIFLDDSNLWISGKKLQGEKLNAQLKNQLFKEDPRFRIDLGKLSRWALDGRNLEKANLYGSEPPLTDSYWKMAERNRFNVTKVDRNHHSGKEKKVDTKFVKDVTKLVAHSHLRKAELFEDGNNIIVMVSGDADMMSAAEAIIEENGIWKAEIVGLENNTSKDYFELAGKYPGIVKVRIVPPDDISFIQVACKIHEIKDAEKLKNGIVFCGISVGSDIFEKKLIDLKLAWPYRTAEIDSTDDVYNLLLVFIPPNAPSANRQERLVDQTIDEYLPKFQKSHFASKCKEIIAYQEYRSRRNSAPSAITTPQVELDVDEHENEVGMETEWKREEKKEEKFYQRFSAQCSRNFLCFKKKECAYYHTDEQKDFFKTGKRPKTEYCRNRNNNCKYGIMCTFAHSDNDIYCSKCGLPGHHREKCESNYLNPQN